MVSRTLNDQTALKMTPEYIHSAPSEALEALEKYSKLVPHDELDWKYYPDIYAFVEWGIDLGKLEIQLDEMDKNNE